MSHECHFDIDRYVYYASYKIYHPSLLVEKAGWIEFAVLSLLHLGLGGRSVSFGDRNASLGEFRFEEN